MRIQLGKIVLLLLLATVLTACGGGSGVTCSPAPQITSSPPTVATAGFTYRYHIDAAWVCGILGFICNDVDGVQLPAGAVINDSSDTLQWTPTASQVNSDVRFVIATEPDYCGDIATQSWPVRVYAPPVIESFDVARSAISPGESTTLTAVFQGIGRIDGLGPITTGETIATPALSISTAFRLIVTNNADTEVSQTLTIEVLEPPVIQSLSAWPDIITVGATSRLAWTTTGDFSVARLDPLGADVFGRSSFDVVPAVTSIYILLLSNEAEVSTSASVQVDVVALPTIESFTATPSSTGLRGTVLLTGQFQDGTGEIEMDNGEGAYTTLGSVLTGQAVDSGELLRSTRFRLVVRNAVGTVVTQDLFVPITGPGTFQPTNGSPIKPLGADHTATRLSDGRVFIAGGWSDDGGSSVTTEIFDPLTEMFAAGPNLLEGRRNHAAALLPDGRVLLVGGHRSDRTRILNAEIYDPGSGTITSAGQLPVSDIVSPRAVALLDGRVLVVHASRGQGAEVFDPLTEIFTPVGPFINVGHACIRAERLPDGRVLVIDGSNTQSSEIFSPGSDSFALTDTLTHYRCNHASAVLLDGRVLIAGAAGSSVPAEIYDPTTNSFTDVGVQQFSASHASASTLASGSVLVVGGRRNGRNSPWAELFDPVNEAFSATGGLPDGHRFHTATVLQDGRVLIIGGCDQLPCSSELYTPP